ncbi:MAG: alpha/beta hydrolase [Bacteroidota bacterium]
MTDFIEFGGGKRLAIHRVGTGSKYLLVWPGFDSGPDAFLKLGRLIEHHYTTLVIDLPYHGATKWPTSSYSVTDVDELFRKIIDHYQLKQFRLLGYSLGARLLLKILPGYLVNYPQQIVGLDLLAPYGITGHRTQPLEWVPDPIVKLLAKGAQSPKLLRGVLRSFQWAGIIENWSYRHLMRSLRDKAGQTRIAGTLMSLPNFKITQRERDSLGKLSSVRIIIGKRDSLMNPDLIAARLGAPMSKWLVFHEGGHEVPVQFLAHLL